MFAWSTLNSKSRKLILGLWRYPGHAYKSFRYLRGQRDESADRFERNSFLKINSSIKTGYITCVAIVASILVLNLVVAIWASTQHRLEDGLTLTLFQGQCTTAKQANFWVHLLVNICASMLFCASTYMMQRLSAPTRRDINATHSSGKSMKIGSLTLTNFAFMSTPRFLVFLLLWASSLPIHLMYNSLIVYTTTNSEWASYAVLIQQDILPDPGYNSTIENLPGRTYSGIYNESDTYLLSQYLINQQPPFARMGVQACVETYASGASTNMGDVLVVTKTQSDYSEPIAIRQPSSHFGSGTYSYGTWELPWQWMCYGSGQSC